MKASGLAFIKNFACISKGFCSSCKIKKTNSTNDIARRHGENHY